MDADAEHPEGEIYNVNDTVEVSDTMTPVIDAGNLTVNAGVFFARQLETIRARYFLKKYPTLKARELFKVSAEVPAGSNSFTYRTYGQTGKSKLLGPGASDLPRADINGTEDTIKFRSYGIEFGYSIDEIEAAAYGNINLDQMRGAAAMRGHEITVNEIAFFGEPETNTLGFFSDGTQIPVIEKGKFPATKKPFTGDWSTAKPEDIVNDINGMFSEVWSSTNMVESATKLVVSQNIYNTLFDVARSPTATSDTTIANFIVQNSAFLKSTDDIIPLRECSIDERHTNTKFIGKELAFVYDDDAEKFQYHISKELTFAPVQHRGLELIVPAHAKVGQIAFYKPKAALIAVVS